MNALIEARAVQHCVGSLVVNEHLFDVAHQVRAPRDYGVEKPRSCLALPIGWTETVSPGGILQVIHPAMALGAGARVHSAHCCRRTARQFTTRNQNCN